MDPTVDRNAIGIVPLVLGFWYAGTVLRSFPPAGSTDVARAGFVLGLCGAAAAIAIGVGILLRIGEFDPAT